MKKLVALLLVLAMAVSLCGCGKSNAVKNVEAQIAAIGEVTLDSGDTIAAAQRAFDALTEKDKTKVENHYVIADSRAALEKLEQEAAAKARFSCAQEAYMNIKAAWDILDQWGGDLYNTWHGCIMEEKKMTGNVIPYLVSETSLSETEVLEGAAATYYTRDLGKPEGVNWGSLTEEQKQTYREAVSEVCRTHSLNFQGGVFFIAYAYVLNGDYQIAKDALETAKENMKVMSEQYSDYEHYPSLKGFFTTANALLDFCVSPTGSFQQYKDLLNDYRKEARDYINGLNYIFE